MRTPVAVSSSAASRGQLHLAAAGEARRRGRTATGRCPGRVPGPGLPLAGEVGAADRLAQHRQRAGVVGPAPGRWRWCRRVGSAFLRAQPHRIHRQRARRCGPCAPRPRTGSAGAPKPAEGAVGRRVGHHRAPRDQHVVAAVGAGGVQHPARQHHRAQAWRRRRRRAARRSPWPAGARPGATPVRWRTMAGWRLVVATMSSARS